MHFKICPGKYLYNISIQLQFLGALQLGKLEWNKNACCILYILDIFWEGCKIFEKLWNSKLWKWRNVYKERSTRLMMTFFTSYTNHFFFVSIFVVEVLTVSYIKNYYKSLKWYIFMIYRFKICQKYTKGRRHVSREKLKTFSSAKLLQLHFTRMLNVSLFLWQQTLWRIFGLCRLCTF